MRCHDTCCLARSSAVFSCFRAFLRVRRVRFPFFEDRSQRFFAAEESDALATIAHAGFENPPLAVFACEIRIAGKTLVKLVSFEKGVVEKLGIVELEVQRWLYVMFK